MSFFIAKGVVWFSTAILAENPSVVGNFVSLNWYHMTSKYRVFHARLTSIRESKISRNVMFISIRLLLFPFTVFYWILFNCCLFDFFVIMIVMSDIIVSHHKCTFFGLIKILELELELQLKKKSIFFYLVISCVPLR